MCRMMPGSLMALDRPDDDFEAGEARLEHLRNGGSGRDVPAARSEPAEPRTHEEYCEALRAADGSPGDGGRLTTSPLTTSLETTDRLTTFMLPTRQRIIPAGTR